MIFADATVVSYRASDLDPAVAPRTAPYFVGEVGKAQEAAADLDFLLK
jgi:hypothetical protein